MKTSLSSSTNYRGISLFNAIGKVFDYAILCYVRWRCAGAQRENTKRILVLFSYGNIICRHLQICYLLYEHTLIINIWII